MRPRAAVWAVVSVALAGAAACGDDGGGDLGVFCGRVEAAEPLDAVFDEDLLEPEQAAAKYDAALETYEALRSAAPGEVRDDLAVLIDLVSDLRDGLTAADPDDPTAGFRVIRDLEDRFADVEQATAALDRFVARECPSAE